MTPIDLRSDTVTRPSPGMRAAMAAAEVGDDQFGDDPTVNPLQERVAELLGKEAALWLPTGTMANQVVLRALTSPGDDVIVSRGSHAVWHETGGSAANAGVQLTEIGDGRLVHDEPSSRQPSSRKGHLIYPPTTLVEVENTHNRAGGVVVPQADAEAVATAARELGIASYLDGARLWNAAAVAGPQRGGARRPFDVAMVSLSKGLGAPGGSRRGRHARPDPGARPTTGGCRAGRCARSASLQRPGSGHSTTTSTGSRRTTRTPGRIAARLAESPAYVIDPADVDTNILVWHVADGAPDAPTIVERARERGVLIFALGPRTFRAVTHLDVTYRRVRDRRRDPRGLRRRIGVSRSARSGSAC